MSKKTYEALPGVDWVNGSPVPEDRRMQLTAAEARFDLEQGRVQLLPDAIADGVSSEIVAAPELPAARSRR